MDPTDAERSPSLPPETLPPLRRIVLAALAPLERFLRIEAASGVLLLLAAAVALAWANSPWAASYQQLWQTSLGVRIGGFAFERSLDWFVNDALMVIFFFVVGLEIRRELAHGELATWQRAALPVAAALGGMLVPAALYLLMAGAPETRSGWGVPMATDIAFALAILALLGQRVPASLRVLLLALAVIDDLGAIVVIALFYSAGIAITGLALAALGLFGIFVTQWFGVRAKLAYVVPGFVIWCGVYAAGIHPTIAGVIIGLVTPVRPWRGPSPADSLIEALHPWVAFGIMPVFALANAGVALEAEPLDSASSGVLVAVATGLVVGKPLGVLLACRLALWTRIARLPQGLGFSHLAVLGLVAGIGFTMALFVAQLAFEHASLLAAAKLGVLIASALAALLSFALARVLLDARAQVADNSTHVRPV